VVSPTDQTNPLTHAKKPLHQQPRVPTGTQRRAGREAGLSPLVSTAQGTTGSGGSARGAAWGFKGSYSSRRAWATPKAAVEHPSSHGFTCFAQLETSPMREHLRHPTSTPALDHSSLLPCIPQPSSPQAAIAPGMCTGGSLLPRKVGGRDNYPEVTGG